MKTLIGTPDPPPEPNPMPFITTGSTLTYSTSSNGVNLIWVGYLIEPRPW